VKTPKGYHYYFRIPEGDQGAWPSWSEHRDDGVSFDVRGDGGGVIAAGSVHPSGAVYEWIRGPERAQVAPQVLRAKGRDGNGQGEDTGNVRSLFTKLLADGAKEGGRNIWLAKVAGHYAKAFRDVREL